MTALGTQSHRLAREAVAGRPLPAEDDPLPKPPGWFVSRLILAESGTKTVRNQLVAERQSEMIESQFMRLASARQFEEGMNGLLISEVSRNYELLDRMLTNHFRVLQEMGVEPKHGSMAPTGTPAAESGSDMKLAIKRTPAAARCNRCGALLRFEAAIALCSACGALTALPGRTARQQDLQQRVDRALRPKSAGCGDVNWGGIGRRGAAIARRPTVSQPPVTARAPTPGGNTKASRWPGATRR